MGYTRRNDLLTRTLDGELVIFDEANTVVHQLNETARAIWEHCDGSLSESELARQIADTFDVDLTRATEDTHRALSELIAQHLVIKT